MTRILQSTCLVLMPILRGHHCHHRHHVRPQQPLCTLLPYHLATVDWPYWCIQYPLASRSCCPVFKGEECMSPPQPQRHTSRPWGGSSPFGHHWHMMLQTGPLSSCFRHLLPCNKPRFKWLQTKSSSVMILRGFYGLSWQWCSQSSWGGSAAFGWGLG